MEEPAQDRRQQLTFLIPLLCAPNLVGGTTVAHHIVKGFYARKRRSPRNSHFAQGSTQL